MTELFPPVAIFGDQLLNDKLPFPFEDVDEVDVPVELYGQEAFDD